MKKFTTICLAAILLSACVTFKTLDLNTLTYGMTIQDVVRIAGKPQRVLSVRNTPDGRQEVLEYQAAYGEVYALEFWNDYLTGYEYLYDDVTYVIPALPPPYFPAYGRPIYIHPDRPGYSNRPPHPTYPNRPESPSRPNRPTQPSRPDQPNRPTTLPARPGQSHSTPDRSGLTRPAEIRPTLPSRGESTQGTRSGSRDGGR